MRDTLRLRRHLAMLACLTGASTVGCNGSSAARAEQQKAADADRPQADGDERRRARPPQDDDAGRRRAGRLRNRYDAKDGADDPEESRRLDRALAKQRGQRPDADDGIDPRFAPIPGDPPYIDGYNPEEEPCPSGNWCGTIASANAIAVTEATDDTLGCAARIAGARGRDTKPIEGKPYEGLSSKPNMQGGFNRHGTELRRAAGEEDACCYHWFEYCSGRPHLGEDGPVQAPLRTGGRTWSGDPPGVLVPPDPELAARLGAAWRADALAEHASIAAFARASIELLAVGAPAELVAGCGQAGLDEVAHARRCFALATAYDGRVQDPGPLPALPPRATDLARLAADTFAEGGVGETIAALVAERSLRQCLDPEVRATLETIAGDEARHAALAWSVLRWAYATGGAEVREAIVQRADALRPRDLAASNRPGRDPRADALADAGRLDPAAHAEAVADAWAEIIDPLLADLLA